MIKVRDLSGKELLGVFRTETGLVVDNQDAYQKYIQERNRRVQEKERIKSLESEVETLKNLVEQLLRANDKNRS